jgi:hypothetical protein
VNVKLGLFALVGALAIHAAPASADTPATDNKPPAANNLPPPPTKPVPEPGPRDPNKPTLGGFLGVGGALSNGAFDAGLGLRVRATKHWTFGINAELNPWLAYNGSIVRSGSFNAYGLAIYRVPLAYEAFNLRTTASFGTSVLLLDLYGAPKYSTGLYFGFNPLGLEIKLSRLFYLVIDPLGLAYPIPHLKGVPFGYAQYRASVGIEVYTH